MILKKVTQAYHYYSSNILLRTIMFAILLNQLLNISLAVINYWEDMIERFMGLKDVVLFCSLFTCAVDLSFRFERCKELLSIIEDKFVGEDGNWSETEICAQYRQQLINLDKRIWNLVRVNIFNMVAWPLIAITLLRLGGVKLDHPPLPCVYYLPARLAAYPMMSYATVYVLQICCHLIFAVVSHVILSSITISIQKSVLDFQLFCSLVDKFDQCAYGYEGRKSRNYVCGGRLNGVENESKLREQTRMLVRYHQKLYNTMRILGENAGFETSVTSTNVCLINCIFLYTFVKTDMVVIRIFTFCFVIISFLPVFLYCNCGQNIINRNEDVRRRLSEVSWMNRPKWFQDTLILMITRSNAEVHLKPYGLYVLNHATFTNILNISYSSSNLLKALS